MEIEFLVYCVAFALFFFVGTVFVLSCETGEPAGEANSFSDAGDRGIAATE